MLATGGNRQDASDESDQPDRFGLHGTGLPQESQM